MELTDADKLRSVAQRYTELLANPQWIPSRAHAEGLRNMLNTAALTLTWIEIQHKAEVEKLLASQAKRLAGDDDAGGKGLSRAAVEPGK